MDLLTPGRRRGGGSRPAIIRHLVLLAALAAVCASSLLQPLMDNDFFWHLKTGEWILDHRALISGEDPFSFTAPHPLGPAQQFSMSAYWLSQVFLNLVERTAGLGGIVLLKIILFLLLLLVMWLRREGNAETYLALMTVMAFALAPFPFERPQVVSFIFFAVLLRTLERLRASTIGGEFPTTAAIICIVLMLAWANMHPGFILGMAAIGLYLMELGVSRAWRIAAKPGWRRSLAIFGTLGGAMLVTLMNPNGWRALQIVSLPSWMTADNMEYMSSVWVFRSLGYSTMLPYWCLVALTSAAAVSSWRSLRPVEAVMLLGTGYFSFTQIRYIPFFLIMALPVAGRCLAGVRLERLIRTVVFAAALAVAGYMLFVWRPRVGTLLHRQWVNTFTLPVAAAEFVVSADLQGRMYNDFSWGGYLIWRLGPARKVFIDGRNLSRAARIQSVELDSGRADEIGGRFFWNRVFDEWGVDWVILPVFNPPGALKPLTFYLQGDYGWEPVCLAGNALVFARRIPQNARVIDLYALDRLELARDLLSMVEGSLAEAPRHPALLISKGDLLVRLNRLADAKAAYTLAAEVSPGDPVPRERLRLAADGALNR